MTMGSIAAMAQPGVPGDDVDDVPLDGGISLIAAGGIAYGAKKLKERRERAKQDRNADI